MTKTTVHDPRVHKMLPADHKQHFMHVATSDMTEVFFRCAALVEQMRVAKCGSSAHF